MTSIKDRGAAPAHLVAVTGDARVRHNPIDGNPMTRRRAGLAAAALLAAGLFALERAIAHMAALKAICGGGSNPHCGWCFAAAGLIAAGLAALAVSTSPKLKVEPVRA